MYDMRFSPASCCPECCRCTCSPRSGHGGAPLSGRSGWTSS